MVAPQSSPGLKNWAYKNLKNPNGEPYFMLKRRIVVLTIDKARKRPRSAKATSKGKECAGSKNPTTLDRRKDTAVVTTSGFNAQNAAMLKLCEHFTFLPT